MKKMKILLVLVLFMSFILNGLTIENLDKPLKGKWDLQLKKLWEIEGGGTKNFGQVQNLKVSEDGRVYVLDNKLKKILIFDKDGKFLSEFGEMGEGPGEFKNFRQGDQLFILKNDLIFVDRERIHYFSLDGKFKKTVKTPSFLKPRRFISKDIFISAPIMIRDSGQKEEEIKSYDILTKTESVISKFKPFEKASTSSSNSGNRMRVGIIIGSITPLMNLDYKNGNLFYGMSDKYKITKRDLKNKSESSFLLKDRQQKPVSKKFLKDFSKRLKQIPEDMKKKIIDGLPKKASFFQRIAIQENGLVYVFVSDPDNNASQEIDVFSNNGKYLYSTGIKLEEGSNLGNITFSKDSLILSYEDEEGEIKVAKYQINQPAS